MGELVFVNIGHAGIRIAESCWKLFCLEHGINDTGRALGQHPVDPHSVFAEASSGTFTPRTLFVDTDCEPIDQLRSKKQRGLFSQLSMVAGKESTSSNFTRGEFTNGRAIIDETVDSLRRITENCDSLQGIIFTHSIGGGTGSGFTSLLTDRISGAYRRKVTLSATVYPSESTLTSIVEPYNAILSTGFIQEYMSSTILFRNSHISTLLDKQFGIEQPTFSEINRYIAENIASITYSMRISSPVRWDLNSMVMNLVPYPRAHLQLTTYLEQSDGLSNNSSDGSITQNAFRSFYNPYPRLGTYMSNAIFYHGNFNYLDVVKELQKVREMKEAQFADWVPNAFKVAHSPAPPRSIGESPANKSLCMLSNNSAVVDHLAVIAHKFDVMYAKRAFVHWYVEEGEDSFSNMREAEAALEKDYENIDAIEQGAGEESGPE